MGIRPSRHDLTRSESVDILDMLHRSHGSVIACAWYVTLAYLYANLGWTSSAHYRKYTENVIFFVFFVFIFARHIWWTKGDTMVQEERLYTCFIYTTVYDTKLWTFWTIQTFASAFFAWIWAQFDHLAAPLGFSSSVHRALNNTETMLFCVCFALPMCDWVVHILDKPNFCDKKTLLPVHSAGIWAEFDHSSPSLFQVQCTQSFK